MTGERVTRPFPTPRFPLGEMEYERADDAPRANDASGFARKHENTTHDQSPFGGGARSEGGCT